MGPRACAAQAESPDPGKRSELGGVDDERMELDVSLLKKTAPHKAVHVVNAILANAFNKENPEADETRGSSAEAAFDIVIQSEGKDTTRYFEDVGNAYSKKRNPTDEVQRRAAFVQICARCPPGIDPHSPKVSDGMELCIRACA